jgi:hypothetical protein
MKATKLNFDFPGTVTLNDEFTATTPFSMMWFPAVDLKIKTADTEWVFNSNSAPSADGVFIIKPPAADKTLAPIDDVELKLYRNSCGVYLVVKNRFAFRLPKSISEIL